jgi:hypothetical protein
MENGASKKWAEEKEDDHIAIERGADGRGGNVVEVGRVVADSEPEGFGAVGEEAKDFADAEFSDVVAGFGELGVDVKDLNAVIVRGEAVEEQLGHVALPVQRRRRLREDDEFHPELQQNERRGRAPVNCFNQTK